MIKEKTVLTRLAFTCQAVSLMRRGGREGCDANPRQRYQFAAEMGGEIERLQKGRSVKSTRTVERRLVLTTDH